MNNSEQAKNGFKTFLITLSVSLVLFSILYYVITDNGSKESVEETFDSAVSDASFEDVSSPYAYKTPETLGVTTSAASASSAFGDLKDQKPAVKPRVVLAGATESTQSSVPETGVTSITYALILSSILLSIGAFIYMYGPRKIAINAFEREVIRSLDKE